MALDTVDVLKDKGWDIPEAAVYQGLAQAVWPGRFEVLQTDPLVLADGAHNPNGVKELLHCLNQYLSGKKLIFLTGVMADKDYAEMMRSAAPYAAVFISVSPACERALPAEVLKEQIKTCFSGPVYAAESVEKGLELAMQAACAERPLCIFGSLYQLGVVRTFFGR